MNYIAASHKYMYLQKDKMTRGVTSTNNSGRMLADKNSIRHRAFAKFSIHLNRKQHPIWQLP